MTTLNWDLFDNEFDYQEASEGRIPVLRFHPKLRPDLGRGEIAVIRPGLGMSTTDMVHPDIVNRRYGAADVLKMHVRLEGSVRIGGDHGHTNDVSAGMLILLVQPLDSEKYEFVNAHRERSVTLICSRELLSDMIAQSHAALPAIIRDFADGRSAFGIEFMSLSPEIRRLAEELLSGSKDSKFKQIFYEAKSLELICLVLEAATAKPNIDLRLRQRDRNRVGEICELIQADHGANLTISELSRAVAWNETQMMECFKHVTGHTIANYRHHIIMDRAYRQLRSSEAKISDVAFDSGYDHPGNFATAFKRMFGMSPREARYAGRA